MRQCTSCMDCAKITSGIERIVLKNCLGDFRARTDAPTRRRRNRPRIRSIDLLRIDKETGNPVGIAATITLPVEEFPRSFIMPNLPLPRLLFDFAQTNTASTRNSPFYDPEEMDAFFAKYVPKPFPGEGVALKLGDVNPNAFMRMVAKIAHAFAIGELGPDQFIPFLPDLILGRTQNLDDFIGCDSEAMLDVASITDLRLGCYVGKEEYVVVGFSLWPSTNAPHYIVVVGVKNSSDMIAPERR